MRKLGFCPSVSLLDVMIGGLCKNNELEKALSLYSEMKELGINPDFGMLRKLISSFSKEGKWDRLLEECWKDMNSQPKNLLYNAVLECLVRNGSIDIAYDLHQAVMGNNCTSDSIIAKYFMDEKEIMTLILFHLLLLLMACLMLVRLEESYELLRQMKEAGLETTQFAHNCIFGCLCRREDVEGAVDLLRKMRFFGHELWIKYSTFVKNLCQHGKAVEACKFLTDMIQEGVVPSTVTFNYLIDGWCKNGEIDQAMLCLSKMFGKEREANVITYATLINGLCNFGRPDGALKLWNEMGRKGCAPNRIAYHALVNGLCKCGRSSAALVHFNEMKEKEMRPDSCVYVALISAFLSDTNVPSVFDLLKEMVDVGNLPDPLDKNFLVIKDAICKLSEDARISSGIKDLIAEGRIPDVSL
ncbi:hypothetical protein REPUB_Repub01dG0146900 [Reevesia pubescens]